MFKEETEKGFHENWEIGSIQLNSRVPEFTVIVC